MSKNEGDANVLRFPENFMWGTATAAYQIEGGASSRGQSIWDTFSAKPGKTINGDNGSVACDHYKHFKEDVQLIKSLGTRYYRLSLSWPRILPKDESKPSEQGVIFYRSLLQELLDNGITPVVTLYHWDLPERVHVATGGWACDDGSIADQFAEYARICFDKLGDLVKWWITLNEPWCSAFLGYEMGQHAPGETDAPGVKIYRVGHNLLLAHAKAVDIYRNEFQERQAGRIAITLNSDWSEPKTADAKIAAQRSMDFVLGWFADPIYKGDYPQSMRESVGERLPKFTEEEKKLLKGSSDFFGLNHYSTHHATGMKKKEDILSYWNDVQISSEFEYEHWKKTDMGWSIVPWGLTKLLCYIKDRYKPEGGIIITENGLAAPENCVEDAMRDTMRIAFYRDYIKAMHTAITEFHVDVRGYFLWSLLDNFEWAFGYTKRFGLFYVDYKTLKRTAKPAVEWYKNVVTSNSLREEEQK